MPDTGTMVTDLPETTTLDDNDLLYVVASDVSQKITKGNFKNTVKSDELIDIRTGADGETYTSAGNAVRGQISNIKGSINKFSIISDGLIGATFTINKWINTSGVLVNGSGNERMATESYIPVVPGDTIKYRLESGHASVNAISFYDYKKTYISGVNNSGTNGTTLTATIPANCVFARFSTRVEIDTLVSLSNKTMMNRLDKAEKDISRANTNIHFIKNRYIDINGFVHTTTDGVRYAVVDYIPVSKGAKIAYQLETDHSSVAAITFYDKSKKLIGSIANIGKSGTYFEEQVPTDCCFVRFSTRNDINTYVEITPELDNSSFIENLINKTDLQDIESLRRNLPMVKEKVQIPNLPFMSGYDLNVYSDGYTYECLTDLSIYKNSSANTYTVRDSSELLSAVNAADADDTIYVADGVYEMPPITKSLNIIAQSKGKALFVKKNIGSTINTSTTGVYKFNLSTRPSSVYYKPDGKAPIKLTETSNTQGTINTICSFNYVSTDSVMFVHLPDNAYPTNKNVFIDIADSTTISVRSSSPGNIRLYLEGINVWGNGYCLYTNSEEGGNIDLIAVDCCFWHSNKYNVVNLLGTNGYFQRCEAAYGYRDGFNYHEANGVVSNGLEIDCIGHDNGYYANPTTEESNNGSTCHDGGNVVRIGGFYYRNYGGNVAETNSDTVSYNYGCTIFDSRASDNHPAWKGDMWCANGAVQYSYGCKCIGDSTYGLDGIDTGTIYYDIYTETGTTHGNVIPLT